MEEIFAAYNCFPFMFLTGRRGSGKSTIAEWVMNCFGVETGGKTASDTTPVAIQRYLSYYSSMPVYIDEYRNSKQIIAKNGFLRNVYNRQSSGKGIKSTFGVREGKVRGTLLVVGEETPEDNALLTRCIVINVLERRRSANHFAWFQNHRPGLSYLAYHILTHKKEILPHFMEDVAQGKKLFVKQGLDDRMALNYSIIGSGYSALFGELPKDFQDHLADTSVLVKAEYDGEHIMKIFWEDLLALQSTGKLRFDLWDAKDPDRLFLYFSGLYSIWASEYRNIHGTDPFKIGAIRKYIQEEPGFLELDRVKRINGKLRRCVVFDKTKTSVDILSLVEPATCDPK